MEDKEYDLGMLTFEDRYGEPENCCNRSGVLNQNHEDYCEFYEDDSHA